jgi:hypothetical protein
MTTAAENLLLNTHPQQTDLYLSIYEPTVLFTCQAKTAYSVLTQEVEYENQTGTWSSIPDYHYLVALIGTTHGGEEKGRAWVRSATDIALRFLESDQIDWAVGDYITVLAYTEIIPVFPRIIQNPANITDVIFYKVYDIAYTNQNSILGTYVDIGCNYAGFDHQVWWEVQSGTSNLKGDALTYSWIFEGATITGSTNIAPGYVTYNNPGHFRTILTVTSSSGATDTAIRYVSLYDRPGEGNNPPIVNWSMMESPNGSRDAGGSTCRINIRDAKAINIRDRSLVVIFKESWYGDTKQNIGGNSKNRQGIWYTGYVLDGTIKHNYADNSLEFEVASASKIMQETECFSVSVESKLAPAKWYELLNMTIQRAIYHYYKWHSTVLMLCDMECNFVDRSIQYFDADRTSLYDACNTLMSGAALGRIICDRQGKLWVEQDDYAIENGATAIPEIMAITKKDWIGDPIIDEAFKPEVAYLEIGGIAFNPGTGDSAAYLAGAPGLAPGYFGKVERVQGLALNSQDDLNTLAGNIWAYWNRRFPNSEFKLRGNFSNLDIAPQARMSVTMLANENPQGLVWTNKAFALTGVSWTYDSSTKILYPSVYLSEIVAGFKATTIEIPAIPPTTDDPPPPYPPPPPPAVVTTTGTSVAIVPLGVLSVGRYSSNVAEVTPDAAFPVTFTSIHMDTRGLYSSGTSSLSDITIPITGNYLIEGIFNGSPRINSSGADETWAVDIAMWISIKKNGAILRSGPYDYYRAGYWPLNVWRTGLGRASHVVADESTFYSDFNLYPPTIHVHAQTQHDSSILSSGEVIEKTGFYANVGDVITVEVGFDTYCQGAGCASAMTFTGLYDAIELTLIGPI